MLTRLKNGTSVDLKKVLRIVARPPGGSVILAHVEVWSKKPRSAQPECIRVLCPNPQAYADELADLVAKAQDKL